jgi:hypothetical protein
MERVAKTIAAVQGAPSSLVQSMFRDLIQQKRLSGRIVGVIEENYGLGERTCSAGRQREISFICRA